MMTAATLEKRPIAKPVRAKPMRTKPEPVPGPSYPSTLEEYLLWKPEDGFKYEWNNGIIEKSTKMITPKQLFLVDNLTRIFEKSKPAQGGRLVCEVQNRTSATQIRIPDIAYYDSEQIKKAANEDFQPVTAFAIEIISDNDRFYLVHKKLKEYFKAGVQVVWLILPQDREVHVYNSPTDVKICVDKTICSAEKAIPGFAITVAELFEP